MNQNPQWSDFATSTGWALLVSLSLVGMISLPQEQKITLVAAVLPTPEAIEIPLAPEQETAPSETSAEAQPPALSAPPSFTAPPLSPALLPAEAFALPPLPTLSRSLAVKNQLRPALVDAIAAAPSATGSLQAGPAPAAQDLSLGVGEGKQPAPRYPQEALRRGQEGTVEILFCVERDGCVEAVEVTTPCPWPLLNQEAQRVIRERWRFAPGDKRRYRVPICFKLDK